MPPLRKKRKRRIGGAGIDPEVVGEMVEGVVHAAIETTASRRDYENDSASDTSEPDCGNDD